VTGTELIRRKEGAEAFAFTCPLIVKSDGGKFGKTEDGNVWLDKSLTSPYQFYQFWLNASDADAEKWIRIFTFLDRETISALLSEHRVEPGARNLQKALAREVTVFVHGEEEYLEAVRTTEKLFTGQRAAAESLSEEDLISLEGIVRCDYPAGKLLAGIDVVSFLAETNILASKGEARKLIQGGGISINRKKIDSPQVTIGPSWLLHERYLLVQKGKKYYFLVKVS
jgi:tyrosyl-tRNA synthetase